MMGNLDELFALAKAAQAKAYVPYSHFKVGAAIATPEGDVFAGCNVENAAYPAGTCAEAGAIAAMVAGGRNQIQAILVIGDGPDLCTPCGACRQRIREFAAQETPIVIAGPDGPRAHFTLAALLPHSFGPENLSSSK
jgi:cytidine deaminase